MSAITDPRQVVLVTCRSHMEVMGKRSEKDNIITVAWHMPVSFSPELYAISIGTTRFSCSIIQKSRAFAVNFIPYTLKEKAVICGSSSGRHADKFKKAGLNLVEAEAIDCGLIKEAAACLECEVINEVAAGDHIIFIGKVVSSKQNKTGKRLLQSMGDFISA